MIESARAALERYAGKEHGMSEHRRDAEGERNGPPKRDSGVFPSSKTHSSGRGIPGPVQGESHAPDAVEGQEDRGHPPVQPAEGSREPGYGEPGQDIQR